MIDFNLQITVLIPTYNQEKYIGRCLRSLLDQSVDTKLYEILVIDDGSTDLTSYALSQFIGNASNIRVITHSTNKGLPATLNTGIINARGKYIVRVDSDDFVNTNYISFLHYYLEENPDSDAVACDYYLLDDKENTLRRCDATQEPIGCGIMFKTKDLLSIGMYDETFKLHEEKELRIRFEKKYKVDHLRIPLYRYRKHEENITNNKKNMKEFSDKLFHKHGIN